MPFKSTLGQPYPKKIFINYYQSTHKFHLEEDGTITVSGTNKTGNLGVGHLDVVLESTEVPLHLPRNDYVVEIFADEFHTFFLTEAGRLYACGANYHGELGVGSEYGYVTEPAEVQLPAGEFFAAIYALERFAHPNCSVWIYTTSGKIYAFGLNEFIRGDHAKTLEPNVSRLGIGVGGNVRNVSTPRLILSLRPHETLKDIHFPRFAFFNYAAHIKTTQRVLVWGNNQYGELVSQQQRNLLMPHELVLPQNEKITELYSHYTPGWNTSSNRLLDTFIFTKTGRIMACGENFGVTPKYLTENSEIFSLEHYHIPPLLTQDPSGKICILQTEKQKEFNCNQLVKSKLQSSPLEIPNHDDISSFELVGEHWRLHGKYGTYLCLYVYGENSKTLKIETMSLSSRFQPSCFNFGTFSKPQQKNNPIIRNKSNL